VKVRDIVYDSGLLTQASLLRHSVGRTVGLVRVHPTTGEETVETATVLSVAEKPIVKYRGHIETVNPDRLVFYELPNGRRSQPTLLATVESGESGRRDLTLGYSTHGLGWSADYIALWNEDAKQLELTGRATLSNTTGAEFPEAELSLIAGSVNRQEEPQTPPIISARAASMMAEAKSMPARQQFADLHQYTVPGKISLGDQQIRQVPLLPTKLLAVDREYVSESDTADRQTREPQASHPQVRLLFQNARGDQAVGPMPAGVVRVFQTAGADGPRWLVGEDWIEHTPEGETVTLNLGEAFDITVLRRQTAFMKSGLPEGVSERSWVIDVKNARNQPAVVKLVELISGEWTILAESAPHEKQTADRLVWRLELPASGAAQLTYRIRVQQ
jgi:hypothetical protein